MTSTLSWQTAASVTNFLSNASISSSGSSPVDSEAWRKSVPSSGTYTKANRNQATIALTVIYPALLTLCTVGNTLNLIVLGLAKKKTTTTCYMMAMAAADILVLWSGLPIFAWNTSHALNLPYKTYANGNATMAVRPYTVWMQEWNIQLCDWALFVFSVERLVAVLRPFGFKCFHQPSTARKIIATLVPLCGVFTVYIFIENYIRSKLKDGFKTNDNVPSWVLEWQLVHIPTELAMVLFKFCGFLLINLWLIVAIEREHKSELGRQRAAHNPNLDRKYRNRDIILISSVALYLISWFPTVIYKCLELADSLHIYNFHPSARLVAGAICQAFAYTNYSVNFFLYLTVSKKYRQELAQLLAPIFHPVWIRRPWKRMVGAACDTSQGAAHSTADPQNH